jgi:hypothetical protein
VGAVAIALEGAAAVSPSCPPPDPLRSGPPPPEPLEDPLSELDPPSLDELSVLDESCPEELVTVVTAALLAPDPDPSLPLDPLGSPPLVGFELPS